MCGFVVPGPGTLDGGPFPLPGFVDGVVDDGTGLVVDVVDDADTAEVGTLLPPDVDGEPLSPEPPAPEEEDCDDDCVTGSGVDNWPAPRSGGGAGVCGTTAPSPGSEMWGTHGARTSAAASKTT